MTVKSTRLRLAAGLAAAGLLALAGCGSSSTAGSSSTSDAVTSAVTSATGGADSSSASTPASSGGGGKQINVAWFNAGVANTYLAANTAGINSVAPGVNATVTTFDANLDSATQLRQMKDALATGKYNAFIVSPVDAPGLVPVAEDAVKQGITVASLSFSIGTDPNKIESSVAGVLTVGYALADNGAAIADGVIGACENVDPCKVAYMIGSPALPSDVARVAGAKAKMAEHSNIQLVATPTGGWDQTGGLKAAQDLLTAHPDLNVIASSAGQAIGGALKAVDSAGLSGKVKLVSNGATTQDITEIRAGNITASAVLLPFDEGATAMKYVAEKINGGNPPAATDEYDLSPIGTIADKQTLSTGKGVDFKGQYSA